MTEVSTIASPARVLELRSVRGTGGGPEKTILIGAAQTDHDRCDVTVCYIRDARDDVFHIDNRARSLGIDYVEIVERGPLDIRAWAAVRRLVRSRGIQVVHAHEYKTDLLALWLARVEGIIPLATIHGWFGQTWKEQHIYYPLDRRLLRRFPLVLSVSEPLRQELVAAGASPQQVRLLQNGIDHHQFKRDRNREQDARRHYGLRPDDVAIGAVGRLDHQKRFELLIAAHATLVQHHPTLKLFVAGEGSERPALEHMIASLGVGDSCRLVGHIHDIGDFHHALDAYVQSSEGEGSPNVVLEAMAFETPIVATDVGGTGDLIADGQDGLLVPSGSSEHLARAIHACLADPAGSRRRAEHARHRVETELSFATRLRALERIYTELIHAQASAHPQ